MKPPKGSPCAECPFRRKSLQGYLGAASQCETRTETLDNVADAVLAVIESYALWESGTVPWTDDFDVPVDATEIVVLNLTEASWVEVSSAVAGVSR